MIIPRKTVCDICRKELRRGDRAYKINHKTIFEASGGRITALGHYDLCEGCMTRFKIWFKEQLKEQNNE